MMFARNFQAIDLNLLKVFDEVMSERNLTRAAHNLSMTQPAVSNALRRLRETLGDDLVRRSGYGVEPTPVGLSLWPTVNDNFVLSMADATAAKIIPGLMDMLETDAPGVSLRVLPLTTRDPRELLEAGTADLAIGHFPGVLAELDAIHLHDTSPSFLHQRLYDGRYVVVMRRDHPLAQGPLSLDDYCAARHLLVSFSGRAYGFVDEALSAISRRRQVVLTVNQFFTAGRVVATTDLLAVLPRHFVGATGMEHTLTLKELPLSVPAVQVDALWHRRQAQSRAHQWLRDAVVKASARGFDTPAPPVARANPRPRRAAAGPAPQ
jgi:DNA-binding transcriptional LysR family regulator